MAIENFKKINSSKIKIASWSMKNENADHYTKLRSSIMKNGQTQIFFVRELEDSFFEVFKGKQAFKIISEKEDVDLICYNYGKISEVQSKLVYLENTIQHSNNYIEVGELIKDVLKEFKDYEIEPFIAFNLEEIKDLINLAEFDWDKYKKKSVSNAPTLF